MDWAGIDHPDFASTRARELEAAIAKGYAGLKISKALGLGVRDENGTLLAIDDARLDPLWARAGELGAIVAIHTADPVAFFEPATPENERWDELSLAPSWSFLGDEFPSHQELLAARNRVIKRHPKTTFLLLHVANHPEDLDDVDRVLTTYPNTMVDVAARIGELGRHPSEKAREFITRHKKRILFGTDIQITARPRGQRLQYRLTLGSVSETPPTLDDVQHFYDLHWKYFEDTTGPIDHPIPIQGRWQVNPVGLSSDVTELIYWKNSERVLFAPWLARKRAAEIAARSIGLSKL